MNNTAIILKTDFPNKQKITILDQALGKLDLWVDHKAKNLYLCNGMLLKYDQSKGPKQVIKNIEIIDIPFALAKLNILFFHHILELCYYFIPEAVEEVEIFDLICFLLYSFEEVENLQLQKVILSRFFLLLGLYPEDGMSKKYFHYLMSIPIDRITNTAIDLKYEKELDLWIIKCVNMHPYSRSFKTMHFLNKIVVP